MSNPQLGGGTGEGEEGRLMQSHVMAELKTCWRGEEETQKEEVEGGKKKTRHRGHHANNILDFMVGFFLQHYDGYNPQ